MSFSKTIICRWLCRLVKPPENVIKKPTMIDLFAGSGSILIAGLKEGWNVIGMELEEKNCEIARERIKCELKERPLI